MTATLPTHLPDEMIGWDEPAEAVATVTAVPAAAVSRAAIAYLLLAVFVIASTTCGFLLGYGIPAGWGCLGLALSSLVAAYLLGQE